MNKEYSVELGSMPLLQTLTAKTMTERKKAQSSEIITFHVRGRKKKGKKCD